MSEVPASHEFIEAVVELKEAAAESREAAANLKVATAMLRSLSAQLVGSNGRRPSDAQEVAVDGDRDEERHGDRDSRGAGPDDEEMSRIELLEELRRQRCAALKLIDVVDALIKK